MDNFGCENKPGFIRWKDFTDRIDEVFGLHKLEKTSPNLKSDLAGTNFVYTRPEITEN